MFNSTTGDGSESSEPYQYRRLASNPAEIRLLQIVNVQEHPDQHSTVLELDIRHIPLDQAGPYIAISYAWGNRTPTHKLLVDGAALCVPANTFQTLYTVYHAIQSTETELFSCGEQVSLWIDAVCINQSDVDEKDDQVRRMGQIYSQALGAIGHIGRPPSGTRPDIGFRTLRWIGDDLGLTPPDDVAVDPAHPQSHDSGLFPEELGPIEQLAEAYRSLVSICLYGYGLDFATMNLKTLTKLLRRANTSLEKFKYVHAIHLGIKANDGRDAFQGETQFQVAVWSEIRRLLQEKKPGGLGLLELLAWTRRGKCTNPKDRVYSLMGMMKEDDRSAIRVDYSDDYTPANLFLDIAIHFIGSPCAHQLLGWARLQPCRTLPNLPSWVPDWVATAPSPTLSQGLFHASVHLSRPLSLLRDSGGGTISALGIPVGPITFLSPLMASTDSGTRCVFGVLYLASQLCYRLQRIAIHTGSHAADTYRLNNEPWHDVIWRTCCMGQQLFPQRRVRLDDRRAFEASLEQFGFGTDALATVALDEIAGKVSMERVNKFLYDPRLEEAARGFVVTTGLVQKRRALGITGDSGLIGSFPEGTRVGDVVVLLIGGEFPVVLRPLGGREQRFELVGRCYVHGIMDGEWIKVAADAAGCEAESLEMCVEFEIQ